MVKSWCIFVQKMYMLNTLVNYEIEQDTICKNKIVSCIYILCNFKIYHYDFLFTLKLSSGKETFASFVASSSKT